MSQARTSRHLSTPKRLARVARLLPRPSRRSWRPEIPPRRTSLRSRKYWGRFPSTLPWILRSHAGRPLRPFGEARRREPAVVCQQPPVVGSTQLGGHRRSRPRSRRDYRNRGKGIARPEQPREPKQSQRAQCPHAWMSAIATARQVCWAADSEQARSRVAWARAVPRDAATSITRLSLGHA